MKKHLSLTALIARSGVYKALGATALASIGAVVMLYINAPKLNLEAESLYRLGDLAHLFIVFVLGIFLVSYALHSSFASRKTSKASYTINRLSVSPRSFFVSQSIFNVAMLLVFYFTFAFAVFLFFKLYAENLSENYYYKQILMANFYKSEFLHGLIPLEDFWALIRNFLLFLALGTAISADNVKVLRGDGKGVSGACVFLLGYSILNSSGKLGDNWHFIFFSLMCLISLGIAVYQGLRGVKNDE